MSVVAIVVTGKLRATIRSDKQGKRYNTMQIDENTIKQALQTGERETGIDARGKMHNATINRNTITL